MARHGVDFEAVKQAALKLLSKGSSPSVQKIRDILGTGSNSTIAEHLKIWRATHAAKKVHHLPATIPEALIATFETLWQTAMEHAEQRFTEAKEALDHQEEKLHQEKVLTAKTITDLKIQHDELAQKIEEKIRENHALQTNIAVIGERLQKQSTEIDTLQQQHELRLKHVHDEKHRLIDEINKLQAEIIQHKQELSEQAIRHQVVLAKERELQESSEKRWIQLIDQARVEAKSWQKKLEETTRKKNDKIATLQNSQIKLQDALTATQATLDDKNKIINTQNQQLEKAQSNYTSAVKELAMITMLAINTIKRTNKKKEPAVV